MIQALLSHSWKEQFRSAVWAKNLVANIFLGLAAIMITAYALLIGIFLKEIVGAILPDTDPLSIINSVVIYYVAFEFFIRFFLQNVPVLSIQPYLHLPIRKAKMINYMLGKSLLSPFNVLSLLFFAPFAIRVVNSANSTGQAVGWLLFIVGLAFMLHYAIILFKKKLSEHPNLIFYAFIVIAGIAALDFYGIVSLSSISSEMMSTVLATPYLGAIPWLATVLFYFLNFNFLVNNTYPEEISIKKKEASVSGDFAFLKRFGHKGELMATEIKLILRHKRPRNTVMFSAIFLFYGLIFYPNPQYQEMEFIFVFVGVFITGIFFIQYGQFLLSWDSSFFDFVLVRKSTFKEYIEAKYYLFVLISTIGFVVSLGYGYFGWKIVLINFCAYLFNIGINVFAVMRIAMFNPKKIDLNKRAAFNYEGVGAAQFLIAIPIMILPYLIYAPLAIFGYADLGIILTGGAGLVGFILREKSLKIITDYFVQNKHKIAAGFRAQ
ncbi:DUF5687 family protein [Roseivirga misakiensis]|uniref:Uncharacterized protein n=1 Tax=Roseivirga misakiensis TaxID=1563681 RepID=A0A1E5T6Z8_9BACT|nr:DUF5687 family protein [Roseivirga misakiensis]OEK07126.1 hypothetical protein BFP71_05570 [Roseivirga misakiensis]